jgi:O-methyltransferase
VPTRARTEQLAGRVVHQHLVPRAHRTLRRLGVDVVRTRRDGDDLAERLPDVPAADRATVAAVAGYTLTSPERVAALCAAVRYLVEASVPGALVECGVWRGGSVLAMLRTLLDLGVTDRDVVLFDTFDAMPAPGAEDVDLLGVAASEYHAAYARGDAYDHGFDYLPFEAVRRLLLGTGYPEDRIHMVRGLVEDTVPAQAPERIALLRLDTDYYRSTRHELTHLGPRVAAGGVLIVDDYGHWRGSRQATDEYVDELRRHGVHLYLHRIDYSGRLAIIPPEAPIGGACPP